MNTKLLSILILLGSAGANELCAQEKAPRDQRPDREALRQQVLERFDLDGDGQLNQQEREAMHAARSKRSQEQGAQRQGRSQGQDRAQGRRRGAQGQESQRGQGGQRRQRAEQGHRPTREQVLQRFDADGDGQLNKAERQTMHQAMQQQRAERGQQGQRGQQRRGQGQQGLERGQQRRGQSQQGLERGQQRRGQGQQGQQGDREQRRAQLMKTFDANQDGQLDEFERQALREAMAKRRAAHGQADGEGFNPEAMQGRARQGRGNAGAPQSDLRRRPR